MRKAVRAIILNNDKLLVMHRSKFGHEYDVLVGGGIDMGETPEQALMREIREETGVNVSNPRLVFVERAGVPYGDQLIFMCDYMSGEPKLDESATEYKIGLLGKNLYLPQWRDLEELNTVDFRSPSLKRAIQNGIKHGFPLQPIDITNT